MLDGYGDEGPKVVIGSPFGIETTVGLVKVVVDDVESGESATVFSCEANGTNEADESGSESSPLEATVGREPISRLSPINRIRNEVKTLLSLL
jgi:hypothetical protein